MTTHFAINFFIFETGLDFEEKKRFLTKIPQTPKPMGTTQQTVMLTVRWGQALLLILAIYIQKAPDRDNILKV
jgi:hypothetical protein